MKDMPAVKWVDEINMYEKNGAGGYRKPVITLDTIEALLKHSYGTFPDYWSDERVSGHVNAIDDLLARVQAWREDTR